MNAVTSCVNCLVPPLRQSVLSSAEVVSSAASAGVPLRCCGLIFMQREILLDVLWQDFLKTFTHTHTHTRIDTLNERLLTESDLLTANPVQQCCHFNHSVVILPFHPANKDATAKAPKFLLFWSPAYPSIAGILGCQICRMDMKYASGHMSST